MTDQKPLLHLDFAVPQPTYIHVYCEDVNPIFTARSVNHGERNCAPENLEVPGSMPTHRPGMTAGMPLCTTRISGISRTWFVFSSARPVCLAGWLRLDSNGA